MCMLAIGPNNDVLRYVNPPDLSTHTMYPGIDRAVVRYSSLNILHLQFDVKNDCDNCYVSAFSNSITVY